MVVSASAVAFLQELPQHTLLAISLYEHCPHFQRQQRNLHEQWVTTFARIIFATSTKSVSRLARELTIDAPRDYHSRMSIRFQCASCGQPIEVDAAWAGKLVGCPFCRKTVTAPTESTFTAPPQIPMALRIPDGQPVYAGRSSATMAISRAPVKNPCAMIAFALASFVVLMFVLAVVVTSAHSMELRELESRWSKTQGGFDKKVEEVQKFLNEQQSSGVGWIVSIMLMEIGSMLASLGALILGIIGLIRPVRRGFAVAALCIAGCTILFFCVGLVFNFA